ncbi:hypothetical protein TNCV_4332541 [Trichonephila clavipes]|nr:hypothetical protein TNCV_4332541 [Trichonephila clavipes]
MKAMLTVFFDKNGVVHSEFVPEGQTVNGAFYVEVLKILKRRVNRKNDCIKTPIGHVYERKNRWNAGILTIKNRSVSNSECGPVYDLKTVAEVSKNGRCFPRQPVSGRPSQSLAKTDIW